MSEQDLEDLRRPNLRCSTPLWTVSLWQRLQDFPLTHHKDEKQLLLMLTSTTACINSCIPVYYTTLYTCSSHLGFNQLNLLRLNNTVNPWHVYWCSTHSPLYGHQLTSLIALAQEHTAIRAVPELLECGVAVNHPHRALALLQWGTLTIPDAGHFEPINNRPQVNNW